MIGRGRTTPSNNHPKWETKLSATFSMGQRRGSHMSKGFVMAHI